MYIPKPFAISDRSLLHRIIRENSFGQLVSVADGVPVATHLPFMVDETRGENGTLIAHMARANPHWRSFGGQEVLAIFAGPHGYVSPSWYEPGNAVPTWNYVAVHAYGVPEIVEDRGQVLEALRALVTEFEGGLSDPWSLDGLPGDYLDGMMKGIVAFEIPIARIEGKAKLSQNRSAADQRRVADAFAGSAREEDRRVAAAMREILAIS